MADDYGRQENEELDETYIPLVRQVPLGIIFARILVVTAMSFAAALAIFLLVGGFWLSALGCLAATVFFLFLMFFIERFAEPGPDASP
jgi:hypothetical protein